MSRYHTPLQAVIIFLLTAFDPYIGKPRLSVSDAKMVQNYQAEEVALDWLTWAPLQSTSDKTLIYSISNQVSKKICPPELSQAPGKFCTISGLNKPLMSLCTE